MSASIIDPFHRFLFDVISSKIDERMVNLAQGGATKTVDETVSTAEKYAAQCAYLQALNDVLGWCKELEQERYGARPGADTDQL